jgi:hypothetical protein
MRGRAFGLSILSLVMGMALWQLPRAAAEEAVKQADVGAGKSCSCKACEPDVCCKTPTGFAPLDEKCKDACRTKTWNVAKDADCGKGEGCCP